MPVTLPRYVAVTLTVTPTGSRSYGLYCALVSSGTPDRRLPTRARFTTTVTHHCHAYRYTRVTLTRRARPATESRALRYRPLAGDATYVTRTTGD